MTRVLIDGRNLGLEKGTGVAVYARNLSFELRDLGYNVDVLFGNRIPISADPLLQEIAFFDPGYDDGLALSRGLASGFQFLRSIRGKTRALEVPISGDVIRRTFNARLPHFDRMLNARNLFTRSHQSFRYFGRLTAVDFSRRSDLAHWTYPLPLVIPSIPNLYTIHDIVPLLLPYTTLDNKKHYLKLMKKLVRGADHIVTVSECTKRDIVRVLGFDEKRITNTYQSVDIPQHLVDKAEDLVAREVEGALGVGYKDYFLFWGAIEPKKNISRMIEAYLQSKVAAPLVIVGSQGWKSDDELRFLDDERVTYRRNVDGDIITKKRILRVPYAPFQLLVSLIRGAKATLFPSLYEGFGLPVLESMVLGTPVICSNTSSLPEIGGDAVIYVDPYDTLAIARAIRVVDADADLAKSLGEKGKLQAAVFSRAAYREKLGSVYRQFV